MLASVKIETLLSQVPLFSELAAAEISRVARAARQIQAKKGDVLFHKNEQCTGLHALVHGQVKLVLSSAQGSERIVDILADGDSFGESFLLTGRPYIALAQTLSECLLLHIAKDAILAEFRHNHAFRAKLLLATATRVHEMMSDIESDALHSGTRRFISYLLKLPADQDTGQGVTCITLPAQKGVIASRLGLSKEHFSRVLTELDKQGLIDMEQRTIRIRDRDSLRRLIA